MRPETVEAIRTVLLDRGIEFTNGGRPGRNFEPRSRRAMSTAFFQRA